MAERGTDGVRGVALPTALCSLACGGTVLMMALAAVLGVQGPAARPAPAPAVLSPARVVAAPVPAPPPVTDAPTATDWLVQLPAAALR
jgi:hypothetical protein